MCARNKCIQQIYHTCQIFDGHIQMMYAHIYIPHMKSLVPIMSGPLCTFNDNHEDDANKNAFDCIGWVDLQAISTKKHESEKSIKYLTLLKALLLTLVYLRYFNTKIFYWMQNDVTVILPKIDWVSRFCVNAEHASLFFAGWISLQFLQHWRTSVSLIV